MRLTTTYDLEVARDKPTAYYKYDDIALPASGSLVIKDSSGNGLNAAHGFASNYRPGAVSLLPGNPNRGVDQKPGGASATITNAAISLLFQLHDFSIEMLLWPRDRAANFALAKIGTAGTTDASLQFLLNTTGTISVSYWSDDLAAAGFIPLVAPTHVILTNNNTTKLRAVYVNGAKVSSGTATGNLNVAAGAQLQWGDWTGQVERYAVYGTALSPGRVAAHAAALRPTLVRRTLNQLVGAAYFATLSATSGGSVSIPKATGKGLVLTSLTVPATQRAAGKMFAVTSLSVPVLTNLRARVLTLVAVSLSVPIIQKAVARVQAVVTATNAAMQRAPAKTLQASSGTTPAMQRGSGKVLAVNSLTGATLRRDTGKGMVVIAVTVPLLVARRATAVALSAVSLTVPALTTLKATLASLFVAVTLRSRTGIAKLYSRTGVARLYGRTGIAKLRSK